MAEEFGRFEFGNEREAFHDACIGNNDLGGVSVLGVYVLT